MTLGMELFLLFKVFYVKWLWIISGSILSITLLYCKSMSSRGLRELNAKKYLIWHSMWHYYSIPINLYKYLVAYFYEYDYPYSDSSLWKFLALLFFASSSFFGSNYSVD